MAYAYLTDPEKQFITKSGTINVSGFLRVYDASTDDLVITYKDFNGTENQADIPLDNNGRAIVIADSERVYRLEVYDRYGTLQWTTSPLWCLAAGGGLNIHDTEVISTNGSIDISKTVVGSTTTFDLGLAPSSTEFLEWCKCLNLSISNGLVFPEFAEGSMTTDEGGLHVYKDRFYHITCTLRVDPTGNGINYDTFSATLKYSDGTEVDLVRRNYDIDNSVNDPTLCEFSYDFNCPADGYLYMYVEGVGYFEQVDVALQVHRVYSGINAVPDTCATQQWVRGYFDFNMSAHIPYSALEYDSNNEISGISGSAIAGNLNSAQVSSIASSYAESAVSSLSGSISSKLDASASAMFQPSGNYYSATNPSGFISTADMSGYAKESSLSSKLDASASSMFQPSGDYAYNSSVSSKLDITASSLFAPSGDYAYNSALSSYIPESASGQFAPSGNYADASSVSSKVDQSAFDDCCSAMSAAVSAKLDASASSGFYSTSNPSGFVDSAYVDSQVSSKQDTLTFGFDADSAISSINGSALAGGGGVTGDFVETSSTNVTIGDSNSASSTAFAQGWNNYANNDSFAQGSLAHAQNQSFAQGGMGNSAVGVSFAQGISNIARSTAFAQGLYNTASGVSFAQGFFNSAINTAVAFGQNNLHGDGDIVTGNSAAFVIGDGTDPDSRHDLMLVTKNGEITMYSGTADTAGLGIVSSIRALSASASSYVDSAYVDSQVSGKLDASASSDFVQSASLSAWIPYSALDYSGTAISGIGGSSLAGLGGGGGDYTGIAPVIVDNDSRLISVDHRTLCVDETMTGYASGDSAVIGVNTATVLSGLGDYQLTADMTAYQLSGDFYSATNPSGFIDSAYVEGQVSGKQDASAMTAYQPAGDYQPSGDYIYASALGIAEV